MKKFISAVTSLCMAATMTSVIVPASINAADATKGLILKAYDQADSKYADAGSKITVSAADIAAGDVVIPCAVYFDEATPDTQTINLWLTPSSKEIGLNGYDPVATPYLFDSEKEYTNAAGQTFSTNKAVTWVSSVGRKNAYVIEGNYQVLSEEAGKAAPYTDNAFIGCAWTMPGTGYSSWTGAKSTDYPLFVFDVTLPKGLDAGTYTVDFIKDYNTTNIAGQINPSTLVETNERYADYPGYLSNLKLTSLEIEVGDGGSNTTSSNTTTTTSATTTTTTTTTQGNTPVGDENLIIDFGTYKATPGEELEVVVMIKSNNGTYPVGGIDAEFGIDSPLEIVDFDATSPAFNDAGISPNLALNRISITPLRNGEPTAPKDAALLSIYVDVPANIDTTKDYEIGFNHCRIFKSGADSSEWTYKEIKGVISFDNGGADTTTTTTTTSSSTTTTTTTSSSTTSSTTTQGGNNNDGEYTPVWGDVNCDGDVNVSDVVLLNKWLNNNADYAMSDQGKVNADCYNPQDSKGGKVKASGVELTAADSDAIIKSIVSLVTLPVTK